MSNRLSCLLALAALFVGACDCKGGQKGPCEGDAPLPGCGNACTVTSTCAPGLFCEEQTCTAQCTPTGNECRENETCNSHGQCVGEDGLPDSGADGNVVTEAGLDGIICNDLNVVAAPVRPYIVFIVDRSGSMKELFPYNGTVDCDDLDVGEAACLSRWQSTRDVLLGTNSGPLATFPGENGPVPNTEGVIGALDDFAFIGMVQYTGDGSGSNNATFTGLWPDLKETPAAVANLGGLRSAFLPFSGTQANSIEPPNVGDTPTGESILATLCHLRPPYDNPSDPACNALNTIQQDINTTPETTFALPVAHRISAPANPILPNAPGDAPVIFVLATDGEPDSSWAPDGLQSDAQRFSMQAVRRARVAANNDLAVSIPTHVVALSLMSSHLEELACEGGTGRVPTAGRPGDTTLRCMNPNAPATGGAIPASDATVLRDRLSTVIRDSIPCSFQLSGTVNDPALARTSGTVTVNGTPVTLDMNNGWWLLDDGRTFTLNGSACGNFRMNPGSSLNASFPCDSGVIIID